MNSTAWMTPLVLLSAEGKRSSKYFPNSASMASSRAAVMRKRYNLVPGDHARAHGSHRYPAPRTGLQWNITHGAHTYPWRYACAADGFKAIWLDGSETRETCYDGFKAVPTALKPARQFYNGPDGFKTGLRFYIGP